MTRRCIGIVSIITRPAPIVWANANAERTDPHAGATWVSAHKHLSVGRNGYAQRYYSYSRKKELFHSTPPVSCDVTTPGSASGFPFIPLMICNQLVHF